MLNENVEPVLERILGKPKERSHSHCRYGTKKGSLVVTLQGEKQGLWHDFQTGEGGNLLHLIAKQSGLDMKADFKKVLTEAIRLLGTSEALVSIGDRKVSINRQDTLNTSKALTEKQKQSLKYARRLAHESQPIAGTLAEQYLREHRGIVLEKWPKSFRFHPSIYSRANEAIKPALLVIAKDKGDTIRAVQAIFLDERTGAKADVKVSKQTWGILGEGVSVDIGNTQDKKSPIYLAEGPETGLSIYAAMPQAHVKVVLSISNFKNIDSKTVNQPIVLCLDNDGNNPQTQKLIHFVAEKLLTEGKQVWVAKPDEIGKDYNDLLKEKGIGAVRAHIEQAIPYANYHDQRATTRTLSSEILSKFTEIPQELFSPSVAEQFIAHKEKEAIKLSEPNIEKFIHFTQRVEHILAEKASELVTVPGSVTQSDIDRYLSTSVKIVPNHNPSLPQTTKQSFILEKEKDKVLDL
jgi:hypothetical protein